MNKHSEAINQFLAENPTWMKYGLRKRINGILEDLEDEGLHNSLGFVPDAFEIDLENKTIRLLEIEDGSRITKRKMESIAFFAFEMDCRMWFTELHIISLITGARSKVTDDELIDLSFEIIIRQSREHNDFLLQEAT